MYPQQQQHQPARPRRRRKSRRGPLIVLVSVLVLVGVFAIIAAVAPRKDKHVDPVTGDASADAETMCQSFVRKQLKAPATAKFPKADSTKKDGATYTVAGGVDAENSFGALVRTPFTCVVHADGGTKWTLVNLDMQRT